VPLWPSRAFPLPLSVPPLPERLNYVKLCLGPLCRRYAVLRWPFFLAFIVSMGRGRLTNFARNGPCGGPFFWLYVHYMLFGLVGCPGFLFLLLQAGLLSLLLLVTAYLFLQQLSCRGPPQSASFSVGFFLNLSEFPSPFLRGSAVLILFDFAFFCIWICLTHSCLLFLGRLICPDLFRFLSLSGLPSAVPVALLSSLVFFRLRRGFFDPMELFAVASPDSLSPR